jgi:hypothetical protein
MGKPDVGQPAIVFWVRASTLQPGTITRFDRPEDAIHSIMADPFAPTTTVAWIKTIDRHIDMEEIRRIARRSNLASYLSRNAAAEDYEECPAHS